MTAVHDLRDDVPALFVPEGRNLVPTIFAVGPWNPDALHGAAVAALFAAAFDRTDATVARITLDLVAAVPLAPLSLVVEDLGGGRRVRRLSAVLNDGDRPVARASALFVTTAATEGVNASVDRGPSRSAPAPPEPLVPLPESRAGWPGFESRAMALHTQRGENAGFTGWFRLLVPAIAGQDVTGLQLALAAADYSSGGTAVILSYRKWSFVSLDLTVNLTRPPVGDWVGVQADPSGLGDQGVAVAASVLHDIDGAFGRCTQTQLVQRIG